MVARKTVVEVPTHMSPRQLEVFYPGEFTEALESWYEDVDEADEDDSFSIDDDGTLVLEPSFPQTPWLWHSETSRWVQADDDDAQDLFPGKEF
jgi:hypothetical protein